MMLRRILFPILALAIAAFWLSDAVAGEQKSADEARAEIKEAFGVVPSYFQVYPESALAGGWAFMQATEMSPTAELPAQCRELISLGVAAQIPCDYCIYYHTRAAKAQGASEQEVREAILAGAVVRHWSTMLQGNQFDYEAFMAETDGFFEEPAK